MSPTHPSDIIEPARLREAIEWSLEKEFGWPLGQSREMRRQVSDIVSHELVNGHGDWLMDDEESHEQCIPDEDYNRTCELIDDLVAWISSNVTMDQWAVPTIGVSDTNSDLIAILARLSEHIYLTVNEHPAWPYERPGLEEIQAYRAKRDAHVNEEFVVREEFSVGEPIAVAPADELDGDTLVVVESSAFTF